MKTALIITGVLVLAVWTAMGAQKWPWEPCRRCGGCGRWPNPAACERAAATGMPEWLYRWMYCSVCRATGVRFRYWPRERGGQ